MALDGFAASTTAGLRVGVGHSRILILRLVRRAILFERVRSFREFVLPRVLRGSIFVGGHGPLYSYLQKSHGLHVLR